MEMENICSVSQGENQSAYDTAMSGLDSSNETFVKSAPFSNCKELQECHILSSSIERHTPSPAHDSSINIKVH